MFNHDNYRKKVLLQFSLEDKNLDEFIDNADDFSRSLEKSLSKGMKFSNLKVMFLGAGKTEDGIS